MQKIIPVTIAAVVALAISGVFVFYADTSVSKLEDLETFSLGDPITVAEGSISSLAADPNNGKIYITYFKKQNEISNLYLVSSSDGGKTFSNSIRVNQIDGDATASEVSPPITKIGPNGEICVLWTYTDYSDGLAEKGYPFGYSTLRFACSSDGGKTFGTTVRVPQPDTVHSQNFGGFEIGSDGTIYVGWLANGQFFFDKPEMSTSSPVVVARSSDGGKSFELGGQVSPISCPCCGVNPTVSDNGTLYVSWRNIYDTPFDDNDIPDEGIPQYRDISIAKSSDGGKTFSVPTKVHDDNALTEGCVHSSAPIALDSKGNLHIAWYTPAEDNPGIYYAMSSDSGKSFSKPVTLLTADQVGSSLTRLTIDDSDNVWVVWEDRAFQDNEMWHYNKMPDTQIGIAKITPDGEVIKSSLKTDSGKLPLIASNGKNLSLVWNTEDLVRIASLSTS